MAHHPDNMPWHLLVSNLRWVLKDSCKCNATNLHPRMKRAQGKEFNLFAREFSRIVKDQALLEREKYPETYDQPESSDVVLDETVVRRIAPTVRRWRARRALYRDCDIRECRRGRVGPDYCQCTFIPEKNKLMASFLKGIPTENGIPQYSYDAFLREKHVYYSLHLLKILLIYEEMDIILRLCAHPNVRFKEWQTRYIFVSSCLVEAILFDICYFKLADRLRVTILGGIKSTVQPWKCIYA